MPDVCRFKFPADLEGELIESQLALAIVATECTLGLPKVRINAAYNISEDKTRVVIDVSTNVGEQIAQIFTGLMIRHFGERGFSVERMREKNNE